jgi:UDP-N-acetylmuramate--alanine ligase
MKSYPLFLENPELRDEIIVIYTPAISEDNEILTWFRRNSYSIFKRSEILGDISARTDTIAISGTQGKTTVSTMTAFLLKESHVGCSAFLGGISKNYNSILILGTGNFTVIEADEYDRSSQAYT